MPPYQQLREPGSKRPKQGSRFRFCGACSIFGEIQGVLAVLHFEKIVARAFQSLIRAGDGSTTQEPSEETQ
jgi:hypothetical protein